MNKFMHQHFLDHPASVDETYAQHARFASGIALRLFLASMAAFVHAIVPSLFERTASGLIAELHNRTHGRGQAQVPPLAKHGDA